MKRMKVFVGMSGGVDSSLTAALLKEQGHDVTGVYMKNWTQDIPGFECPWMEDYQDAKRVAVRLGIPFEVFDFQNEYRHKVVDYMIEEYKAGRTPNPDIMCNQEVKFKLFLDAALEKGADMIATGHYAVVQHNKTRSELRVAANSSKDQTYFLYQIKTGALARTLFPIGEYQTKKQVREDAKKRGIQTADKKDSQGICFVGKVGIKEFLSQYVKTEPGPIVNAKGLTIGEHDGAIFYTIGQRHGLNVGGGLPYYVSHKDMAKNIVYVTTNLDDPNLWHQEFAIKNVNWINEPPEPSREYMIRLRYRGPLIPGKLKVATRNTKVELKEPQRGVVLGQSAVIYDGDRVVGGGIISN